jgi:hypothetical protein
MEEIHKYPLGKIVQCKKPIKDKPKSMPIFLKMFTKKYPPNFR